MGKTNTSLGEQIFTHLVSLLELFISEVADEPVKFCIYRQSHPHEEGTGTLSACQLRFTRAACFLSALPVLIVPPGAFFFLLVLAQLSLKVTERWWPQ